MKNKIPLLCGAALCLLSALSPVQAQSATFNAPYDFTALTGSDFTNSDGADSQAGFVSSGNTLYGTAYFGGNAGNGTVFGIVIDGPAMTLTNLHSFSATNGPYLINYDGANPIAGLILSGNTLYGTTQNGGAGGSGSVFRVNTDGSNFTNLYSFTAVTNLTNGDGAYPAGGLVLSGDTLYGTAESGGSGGVGAVFSVNIQTSDFLNLHNFPPTSGTPYNSNSDGAYPSATLVLSGNTLYGTAQAGGNFGNGTVFSVNTVTLGFTNLYDFTGTSSAPPYTNSDGAIPLAGVILSGNTLYGTAYYGGSGGNGTVFRVNTDGSNFASLYNFTATNGADLGTNADGANPVAGLLLLGQTLYGTAPYGGDGGNGTVFSVRTDGSNFMNLYDFTPTSVASPYTNSEGAVPFGGLMLSGSTLYSTTAGGGSAGNGTVFAVGLPAPPLGILPVSNQVVISWPAWGSNFVLQAATNLSSGTWSNITSGLAPVGTNYVFTNALSGQAAYFRLQQQ